MTINYSGFFKKIRRVDVNIIEGLWNSAKIQISPK